MIADLWKSTKEGLLRASVDDSFNVYKHTNLYLREDRIKTEEEEDMFCAFVAASDVYHDANVYLQDYYRKPAMSNAFMPSSSYGGRDAI